MQHFKLFVEACLNGRGLDKQSYDILMIMVKEDRNLAFELHSVLENIWLHPNNVYMYKEYVEGDEEM